MASAAAPAMAPAEGVAGEGRLTIVNHPAWYSDGDPRTGTAGQAIAVFTPQACPPGTTRHKTSIVEVRASDPADQAEADAWLAWGNLYSPVAAELPGPLVAYPASMNWTMMAGLHGLSIVPGRYELVTRCQDNLGQRIFREWTGAVVFDTPSRYHVPAPNATSLGRTAMAARAVRQRQQEGASPSATAAPSASAAPTVSATAGTSTHPGPSAESAPDAESATAADQRTAGAGSGDGASWAALALAVVIGALLLAGGVVAAARGGRAG